MIDTGLPEVDTGTLKGERSLSVVNEAVAKTHKDFGLDYPADYSKLEGGGKIEKLRARAKK